MKGCIQFIRHNQKYLRFYKGINKTSFISIFHATIYFIHVVTVIPLPLAYFFSSSELDIYRMSSGPHFTIPKIISNQEEIRSWCIGKYISPLLCENVRIKLRPFSKFVFVKDVNFVVKVILLFRDIKEFACRLFGCLFR